MFDQLFLTLLLSLYCPLTYPGAYTLLSISSTPTLHELGKLTVGHAASQWEAVAPRLVVESCGVCKSNGSGHLQEASRGVLNRWLQGDSDTNIAEKTRYSVLEAQETSGNFPLAEQLKLFEESSGEPVTGLGSPPGMCVYRIYVWILFVMSIHCTALSTCQWLLLHFHMCIYIRQHGSAVYVGMVVVVCIL